MEKKPDDWIFELSISIIISGIENSWSLNDKLQLLFLIPGWNKLEFEVGKIK